MDLNPLRRKRERDIARDLRREFMKNITTETGASNELLAHHFGIICQRLDFTPTEDSAKRILKYVSDDITRKRGQAERLLKSFGE
jgi:tRNA(Ile)-lysidine synthase TilS/MesJ